MKRNFKGLVMAAMVTLPQMLWAEDVAVIIANDTYEAQPSVQDGTRVIGLQDSFRQAGFAVQVLRNTTVPVAAEDANRLWARLNNADRLVVVLSGHMVNAHGQTYLLHSNAQALSPLSLGQAGLPIAPYLDLAAQRHGDALVVVADDGRSQGRGDGISDGVEIPDLPQGVTWISGAPRDVAEFVAGRVMQPGVSMFDAAQQAPGSIKVLGFVPRSQAFVRDETLTQPPAQTEFALWQFVRQQNTADGYADYLTRFPNGQFAVEARQREANLRLTPADRARLVEEALGLNRNQRRAIQRQLSLLGFDTRGVDGVFGPNTRTATTAWQNSIGLTGYGYWTANQITQLEAAAAIRAEELRIEAEKRRLIAEAEDRNFWNQSGASGDEAGVRAYLQKYPDGLFSKDAKALLAEIERERRRLAEAEERDAWNAAVMQGTADSYLAYLNTYPNGLFREEAQARYQSLTAPEVPQDVVNAAKNEESRLSLNGFSRQLIEAQLRSLNLDPGRVDGKFTDETRRALRNYQRASGLVPTGYVTRNTVVRLLASAVD